MKNLAKLTLFFSICFVLLFVVSMLLAFLSSWIGGASLIPAGAAQGGGAADFAWKALPAALYVSVLLALSYSARRNMGVPLTVITIFVLGCLFCAGLSLGISRAAALNPALAPGSSARGEPGLILSGRDNSVILLTESGELRGPRVVSFPDIPLIYQETPRGPNNTAPGLPALSFGGEKPWFIRSLEIDFALCAGEIKSRFGESFLSFAAYVFSLVLLLGSLRFIFDLSRWPLANIFLGALVFRLVLTLETFLNAEEIHSLISSFLKERAPRAFITPLVFALLGVFIIFYTLLASLARASGSKGAASGEKEDD